MKRFFRIEPVVVRTSDHAGRMTATAWRRPASINAQEVVVAWHDPPVDAIARPAIVATWHEGARPQRIGVVA